MASSTFEYLVSSTWTNEPNYIRMTLTDTLYLPMQLNVTIANHTSNVPNSRESVYKRFQKVRVIEGNSNRIIFYGKIEKIDSSYEGNAYGQTITLVCNNNLHELSNQQLDEDGKYTGTPTISSIIEDIINGGTGDEFTKHAWTGNIGTSDTAKFVTSGTTLAASEGTKNFSGSSKSPLRAIEEFALNDPQTGATHLVGHEYFLDNEFDALASSSTGNPIPDFNYHSRGTVPETPATNGLTFEYKGPNGNLIRPIMPNYTFPRRADEIVTKVRVEYVTGNDSGYAAASQDLILINHATPSGGTFTAGDTVTWNGNTAYIKKVFDDDLAVIIGPENPTSGVISTDWLNTISADTLNNGGGVTAVVNLTTDALPGSIRETLEQDIQVVVQQFESELLTEAVNRAAEVLQHGGDVVTRGNLSVHRWPYHKITDETGHVGGDGASSLTSSGTEFIKNGIRIGDEVKNVTDGSVALITAVTATTIAGTLVGGTDNDWDDDDIFEIYVINRAGHSCYIKSMPPSDVADQDAIITSIEYTEGPGVQQSVVEVLLLASNRGAGLSKNRNRNLSSKANDGSFNSPGSFGPVPLDQLRWSYTGTLSTPTDHQVDWTGGTLTFSNASSQIPGGSTFTITTPPSDTGEISAGAPGNGSEWIYFDAANPTVFASTAIIADALGANKVLIAECIRSATGTVPTWIVGNGVIQGSINVASMATAITGDMRGWNTTVQFTAASASEVTWTAGLFESSDGTTYTISSGTTDTMIIRTYIYFDTDSPTIFQSTTIAGLAVGAGKTMVATASPGASEATFFLFGGGADTVIDGGFIAASTITANEIAANTISATELLASLIITNTFLTGNQVGDPIGSAVTVDSSSAANPALIVTGLDITSTSAADPTVVTTTAVHGFTTGDQTTIINHTGFTGASVSISTSSIANPTVVTTSGAHGMVTGNETTITGHSGSTPAIDGTHVITVLDSTNFTIDVAVTVAGTGGTSIEQVDGTHVVTVLTTTTFEIPVDLSGGGGGATGIATTLHGLVTGDSTTIAGHSNGDLDGSSVVTVITPYSFTIPIDGASGPGIGGTSTADAGPAGIKINSAGIQSYSAGSLLAWEGLTSDGAFYFGPSQEVIIDQLGLTLTGKAALNDDITWRDSKEGTIISRFLREPLVSPTTSRISLYGLQDDTAVIQGDIYSATIGNPTIVQTDDPHGLTTGTYVTIKDNTVSHGINLGEQNSESLNGENQITESGTDSITSSSNANPTSILHDGVGFVNEVQSDTVLISGHIDALSPTVNIASSTTANPGQVVTSGAHGLVTGNQVEIVGHTSTPNINGSHVITFVSSTIFSITTEITAGVVQLELLWSKLMVLT